MPVRRRTTSKSPPMSAVQPPCRHPTPPHLASRALGTASSPWNSHKAFDGPHRQIFTFSEGGTVTKEGEELKGKKRNFVETIELQVSSTRTIDHNPPPLFVSKIIHAG